MNDRRTLRAQRGSRAVGVACLVLALAGIVVASGLAANVVGTARSDTLRGTGGGDRLAGLAGNDRLFGLGGADTLNGGPGNDVLTGGPGRDALLCGPGNDTARADAADRVAPDCENVTGLPRPGLSVADASTNEGNAGPRRLQFPVVLAKSSTLRITVAYRTGDGTAAAGSDYTAASGTLSFAPGETTKVVSVDVLGDTAVEGNETFSLTLSSPLNGTLARATAMATITNDDVAKPSPGRYGGSTSQGKPVSFDVSADVTTVSNLSINLDLRCQEVPVDLLNERFDIAMRVALSPDWGFSWSDSYSDADGSISARFDGRLAVGEPASGTFRIDLALNISGLGTVHCSTGDVTWTASPPA